VACDSCHAAGWETDCTYCHGGELDATGAPPQDIDDNADPLTISFPEHAEHVGGPDHPAYDCVQCHVKPTDALSAGHLFDDLTPAVAEVDLSAGISSGGQFDGTSTCTNLWCHGDGAGDNGRVRKGDGPLDCNSCHPQSGLNDEHAEHLGEGVDCAECHPDVSAQLDIVDPTLHVDGAVQIELPATMDYDGQRCDGVCHGETHVNRTW
jgi:predicted CxxxxCH...CXXCH cytochrome family protein